MDEEEVILRILEALERIAVAVEDIAEYTAPVNERRVDEPTSE